MTIKILFVIMLLITNKGGYMKRLTFDIDQDLFYEIKIYCAKNKISIKDFITNLIKEKLKK